MCVRLCDGFYWPLSHSATRPKLEQDRRQCEQQCGDMGRLYFARAGSSDASELVDTMGRPYTRLPTAFLYRKTLVAGCACKPEPWALSERMRHANYQLEALRQRQEAEQREAESVAQAAIAGSQRAASASQTALADVSAAVVFGADDPRGESTAADPPPMAPPTSIELATALAIPSGLAASEFTPTLPHLRSDTVPLTPVPEQVGQRQVARGPDRISQAIGRAREPRRSTARGPLPPVRTTPAPRLAMPKVPQAQPSPAPSKSIAVARWPGD